MAVPMKELEDQLNCLICLDTVTNPKLLHCNHVFCQECLVPLVNPNRNQHGNLTLTCPTCRQITPLAAGGVRSLQPAFWANKLLEILKNVKKATEDTLNCLTHQTKGLDYYCESCEKLICADCTIIEHNGHKYDSVENVFEKQRSEILSSLIPADEQLKTVSNALDEMNARYREVFDQQSTLEAEIHKSAQVLHEAIENRKRKLVHNLHQLTREKLRDLASQRAQIETIQAQLISCLDYIRKHLQTETQAKVLKMKNTLVSEITELTAALQPDVLIPQTEPDIKFSFLQNAMPACQNFGQIYTLSSPDSSKSYIKGKKTDQAAVGQKLTTLLQVINFKGEPCIGELESLTCELISEITGTKEHSLVERREESQYEITYQPTIKGRHQLHIKISGQHIRRSPFTIAATSLVENLGSPLLTIDQVRGPWGVAINHRGEVVITEHTRHCISTFSPNGDKKHSFGTPGMGQGQFKNPCAVTVDLDGNIFAVDDNNHRIQKFTPKGQFITSVGQRVVGPKNFDYFHSITFNRRNAKIYVVNACCIQVLNSDLTCISTFGKPGNGKGQFDYPWGIACDSSGKVYVANSANHRIQVFTAEGKFVRQFGRCGQSTEELHWPYGIAIDTNDMVYVSELFNHRISVFTQEGQFLKSFGAFGEELGQFKYPYSLAVDVSGVVYICDYGNDRAQVL